jgi:hypothetical protein
MVMKGLAICHDISSQTLPMRREVECSPKFWPWDFGKRMEGAVVKSNAQRIDGILIRSASSRMGLGCMMKREGLHRGKRKSGS